METIENRLKGALWSIFIADSLSMPVHWYYNPMDIISKFGQIKRYEDAPEYHPSSIMHVANTGGHGRGSQEGSIVGDVILKGKKKFWGKKGVHYHHGMKAGANTLNALCLRVLLRNVIKNEGYDSGSYLDDYINFMTTKDSHQDVYAESYHRDFFKNWSSGVDKFNCAGDEGHDTASIGGFVQLPAIIFLNMQKKQQIVRQKTEEHLFLTHKSKKLSKYAQVYSDMLLDILNESELGFTKNIENILNKYWDVCKLQKVNLESNDLDIIGRIFSPACYIEHSFPSLLFLARKHKHSVIECLLANTNVGGENCHRGSALGAIVGAIHGYDSIPKEFINGLRDKNELEKEINSFVDIILSK